MTQALVDDPAGIPHMPAEIAPWGMETTDLAGRLGVDPDRGLSAREVESRLAADGPNLLASTPPRPAWHRFLDQFRDPLIYLLTGCRGDFPYGGLGVRARARLAGGRDRDFRDRRPQCRPGLRAGGAGAGRGGGRAWPG